MPAARAVVDELGVGLPVSRVQVLSDNLTKATSVLRGVTILVAALAMTAAFLAAFGLYAVVSAVVWLDLWLFSRVVIRRQTHAGAVLSDARERFVSEIYHAGRGPRKVPR